MSRAKQQQKLPEKRALKHSHVIVYPCYIASQIFEANFPKEDPKNLDPKKFEAKKFDGRKISKEDAIDDPRPRAMLAAAQALGFEVELQEDARHPRDFWRCGRLSVKFFDGESEDKKPLNAEINTRMKLYRAIAKQMKIAGPVAGGAGGAKPGGAAPKMTSQEKAKMKREARKKKG